MALTAQARNVATGRVHAYLTVRGAVAGALSLALVELASLVWMRLAAPVDDATARASSEVAALGVERGVIVLRLVLAIALCGAVIGAAHALMRSVGAALSPTRRRPTLRGDVGWTFATVVVWTMARACTVPGLIVPSLPAGRLVGWVVRHAHPAVFHVCMVGLVLAALWPVRGGWRSTPRPATCELGAGRRLMGYAVAAAVVLVSVVGTVVWRHGRTRPAGRAGPLLNVLVLAADSVRPDHISRLGYGRRTTPHIDALIDDGALFERAMAPLARTTPSWLSVLTGRYPHHHGIRHMFPRREVRARSMQALPKWARAQGYRTSVISDYAGDFFSLFDLGFETEKVPPPLNLRTVFERELLLHSPLALSLLEPLPSSIRPRAFRYLLNDASASRLADEAIASLDGDGPFFSVVFFSATHVPFASPYPYYRRFSGDDYAGPNAFAYDIGSIADISRAEEPLSPTEAAHVIALYDGALASVDDAVGRILEALDDKGLAGSTLVLFLADHGENLFEAGQTTMHGKWFRGGDEANRVPLVVRGPSIPRGLRVAQPVSLVDVTPTILDLVHGTGAFSMDGRSLAPALRGESLPEAPVFAETGIWMSGAVDSDSIRTPPLLDLLDVDPIDDGQIVLKVRYEDLVVLAKHRAVWRGSLKLIYEPTPTGARYELFDLGADPHQTTDLFGSHPAASELKGTLERWLSLDPEREMDVFEHVVRHRD